MCNITTLPKGVMPDFEKFSNCCYNNWHSYGFVTKIDGKLDIRRVVPKSGEIDPKELYEALDKDVEFERFVHVRHNTAGATDLRNCHPFEIYYNPAKGRQIVFMHNGTIHEHKSKKTVDGKTVDDENGPSDSLNYATNVLQPLLASLGGDITTPINREILRKFWTPLNRGLLIASDQDPIYLGDWKEIDFGGTKCKTSTLDYFDRVQRGPEHIRREVAKEKARGKTAAAFRPFNANATSVTPLKNFDFEKTMKVGVLSECLSGILQDWEVYDRPGLVSLGYATQKELEELYSNKNDCLMTMDLAFTDYASLYKEFIEAEEKAQKQEKIIEKLALKLKELGAA